MNASIISILLHAFSLLALVVGRARCPQAFVHALEAPAGLVRLAVAVPLAWGSVFRVTALPVFTVGTFEQGAPIQAFPLDAVLPVVGTI